MCSKWLKVWVKWDSFDSFNRKYEFKIDMPYLTLKSLIFNFLICLSNNFSQYKHFLFEVYLT